MTSAVSRVSFSRNRAHDGPLDDFRFSGSASNFAFASYRLEYFSLCEKTIERDTFTRGWQKRLTHLKYHQRFEYVPKSIRQQYIAIEDVADQPPAGSKRGRLLLENQNSSLEAAPAKAHKPLPPNPPRKSRAVVPKAAKAKKPRGPKKVGTPLQRFKAQTLSKKAELKKARRDIDKELKAIEKDLGVLKRK